MLRGALNIREASVFLGLEPSSRWLDEAPVPRVDIRKPGASRAVWRWRIESLDAFLRAREVAPGAVNPQDM